MTLLLVLALPAAAAANPPPHAGENQPPGLAGEPVHAGYLIGFHGRPDADLIRNLGGQIIRTYDNFPLIHAHLPEQAIQALRRAPAVRFVEHNMERRTLVDWDDECPSSTYMCGIGRIKTLHLSRLGTQAAWKHPSPGSKGNEIRLAILDTGIEASHRWLVDNVAEDGFTAITSGPPAQRHWLVDPNGHGTHVAGIAGASGRLKDSHNALAGIAPEVELVSVKVLNARGGGDVADIAAGIDWCIDNDIDIINMSFGGGYSEAEEVAAKAAWDAGLLLVAAAGNSGTDDPTEENVAHPAALDEVIAVAGTGWQVIGRPPFSSTGPQIEFIAPGFSVFSSYPNEWESRYMHGTSMASPHVAGVAALAWAVFPESNNEAIRQHLHNTAEDLGIERYEQGSGLIRADWALGINTGRIKGYITNPDTERFFYAAAVIVEDQYSGEQYVTHTAGWAGYNMFVPPGTYSVTAVLGLGYDAAQPVTIYDIVVPDCEMAITSVCIPVDEAGHPVPTYTVTGTVTLEGNPLPGVQITCIDVDYTPENESGDRAYQLRHRAVTCSDGTYQISGVEEGTYEIIAAVDGVSVATTPQSIDGDLVLMFELHEIEPPPAPEQYTLTVSSSDGGSVTGPGEGTFTYDEGTVVSLVATPDSGYQFAGWTGDTAAIADVNAASTTITMNADYSIAANFEEEEAGLGPVVSSVFPAEAGRGDRLTVTISGSGFQSGAEVDLGDRVIVQGVTFVHSGRLDAQIRVHSRAEPGPRNVTVANPDGQSDTLENGFTVR